MLSGSPESPESPESQFVPRPAHAICAMTSWDPPQELLLWRLLHQDKASKSKMAFGEHAHLERGEVLIYHKAYVVWALEQHGTAVGSKHQDFVNFAATYVRIVSGDLVIKPEKMAAMSEHQREVPQVAQEAAQAIVAVRILLKLQEVALQEAQSAVTIAMAEDSVSVCEILEVARAKLG